MGSKSAALSIDNGMLRNPPLLHAKRPWEAQPGGKNCEKHCANSGTDIGSSATIEGEMLRFRHGISIRLLWLRLDYQLLRSVNARGEIVLSTIVGASAAADCAPAQMLLKIHIPYVRN